MPVNRAAFILAALSLNLSGCGEPETPTEEPVQAVSLPAPVVIPAELASDVAARSSAVCATVDSLHEAVTAFLESPDAASLATARTSWTTAHQRYRELAALYNLGQSGLPQVADDRDPIDAYPILPGYLDEVTGYPRSGMVYSDLPLTLEFLREEHQSTDFYYLTRGFHPLEFMLWGDSANRHEAFVAVSDAAEEINAPQRRRDLTRLMSEQLTKDIRVLCSQTEQQQLASALARQLAELPPPAPAPHEPDGETQDGKR